MIDMFRESVAAVGGLRAVLAFGAIAWGIVTLQRVADTRGEVLDDQLRLISQREAELVELARQRSTRQTVVEVPADVVDGPIDTLRGDDADRSVPA